MQRRLRSGAFVAIAQLDGATIKRVIDDWGRTPQPYRDAVGGAMVYPPAYQQVLGHAVGVSESAARFLTKPLIQRSRIALRPIRAARDPAQVSAVLSEQQVEQTYDCILTCCYRLA
jgi:hypothetical protein